MNYIVHARFKGKALCGEVNLPAMTEVQVEGSVVYYDGEAICALTSENGMKHFARNDDGQGMTRGKLTQAIMKRLAKRDDQHQARWDKVWDDAICQKYKRTDHSDYWLWSRAFYDAPIQDLRHIAALVNAKVGVNG